MQKRELGKSNLEVSAIGLGDELVLRPPQDTQGMTALLQAVVERGVTFLISPKCTVRS
jgi:aryl-alcohol dehydrogenase-like predicted oxidoreductase